MLIRALLPFLFVLAAIGLYFGYVQEAWDNIQKLRAEDERFSEALDQVQELAELRDRLFSRYNSFPAGDLERLEALLPDDIDAVRFVYDLDALGRKHNVAIQEVDVKREDEFDVLGKQRELFPDSVRTEELSAGAGAVSDVPYSSVVVTFSATGAHEDFVQFLADIEASLRLLHIAAVSVDEPVGTQAQSPSNIYTVSVRTFWLK